MWRETLQSQSSMCGWSGGSIGSKSVDEIAKSTVESIGGPRARSGDGLVFAQTRPGCSSCPDQPRERCGNPARPVPYFRWRPIRTWNTIPSRAV